MCEKWRNIGWAISICSKVVYREVDAESSPRLNHELRNAITTTIMTPEQPLTDTVLIKGLNGM